MEHILCMSAVYSSRIPESYNLSICGPLFTTEATGTPRGKGYMVAGGQAMVRGVLESAEDI